MDLPILVIDARMVFEIPHGIARFVSQITTGLSQLKNLSYRPVFLINRQLQNTQVFSPFEVHKMDAPFLHWKELFEIPRVLKRLNAAAYHSPSFSSLLSCPCPSILTLHDLNHIQFGSLSKKIYYQTVLRSFAKRSTLTSVSKFSQTEIAQWLGIPSSQIHLIYNAVSRPEATGYSDAFLNEKKLESGKYFFCLSNPKPHKNLSTLVQAYRQFSQKQKNPWPLVLATHFGADTPGVRAIGGVTQAQATLLLKNCSGLFFPSSYEGFGLPPLEGALQGVPIAISKIPPHQEGLVDLESQEICWVSPFDTEGWVSAFQKVQNREVQAPSLTSQAKILDRFSLEKMARSIDSIYQTVLAGSAKMR